MTSISPGTPAVLDPARKRSTLLLLYFAAFATMMGYGIIVPALPLYAEVMGATGFWLGVIFASFALSRTLFLSVFGNLSDLHGRRLLLLIGLSGYAAFSAMYILADSVETLALVRFLHGIAAAMVFPVAEAYIGDLAESGEEGRLLGEFNCIGYLGMGFGPLISGILMDHLGINAAFLALALLSAMTAAVCLLRLPDVHGHLPRATSTLTAVCHPLLRIPIFVYLVYSVAYVSFTMFLPVIGRSIGNFSGTQVGILIFVGLMVMAGAQKLCGRIADTSNKYAVLAVAIATTATASILIASAGGVFAKYLGGAIIIGCGLGACLTTVSALVVIAGRETGQGSAAGVVNMAWGVGIVVVPVIFGVVMDSAGITMVFLATAATALAAVPVLLSAGRTCGRPCGSLPGTP